MSIYWYKLQFLKVEFYTPRSRELKQTLLLREFI